MSLASSRSRRANAGSKMNELLGKEDEEFYQQAYGGFIEEDGEVDNEYEPEASDDDVVDSDFDIEENDELIEQDDEEEKIKKKTKGYKEPPKEKIVKKKIVKPKVEPVKNIEIISNKKSVRDSTKLKSEQTAFRLKLDLEAKRNIKKRNYKDNSSWRKLTQEELLKEAKITEKINLKSLEKYRKLELEKAQKSKFVKEVAKGPRIIFKSTSMPFLEVGENGEVKETGERFARNFITFTDEETFAQYCNKNTETPTPANRPICPISGLRARYFDPVTHMPFSSANTFKALREAYCHKLEMLGDPKQPDVAKWLEWRKRHV